MLYYEVKELLSEIEKSGIFEEFEMLMKKDEIIFKGTKELNPDIKYVFTFVNENEILITLKHYDDTLYEDDGTPYAYFYTLQAQIKDLHKTLKVEFEMAGYDENDEYYEF